MSLADFDADVPSGTLALWWLGQAGFAFKTSAGKVVFVDPYLTDAAERLFGFKRLSLPPITAEEVRTDLLILTHEHADHLDPDALPSIAKNNPACRFAAPAGCAEGLDQAGVKPENRVLLEPNRSCDLQAITVHTAPADHGDLSATALSLALECDGVRVYCTGDTSFRPELQKTLYALQPDVLLPCINGTFGNMNHLDAAMMAGQVRPRFAIPCHYWTFAEHGPADPGGFVNACAKHCPEVKTLLLKPGERFLVSRS